MANIPMKDIQFPGLDDTYTFAQVDDTLTTQGKAADAKKTGDEITELKADLEQLIIEKTETGDIIFITDGSAQKPKALSVEIPYQENGLSSMTMRFHRRNMLCLIAQATSAGVTYTPQDDGTIHISGSPTSNSRYGYYGSSGYSNANNIYNLPEGKYTAFGSVVNSGIYTSAPYHIYKGSTTNKIITPEGLTHFTNAESQLARICNQWSTAYQYDNDYAMFLGVGECTLAEWDAPSKTHHELSAEFGGTIYGGTVDLVNGVITSKYASDGTELITPETISFTPPTIPNLYEGANTIWASVVGSTVSMTYVSKMQDYVDNADKKLQDQIDSASDKAEKALSRIEETFCSLAMFEKIGIIGDSYAMGSLYIPNGSGASYVGTYNNLSWGKNIQRLFGINVSFFAHGGLSTRTWLTSSDGMSALETAAQTSPCNLYWFGLGINDVGLYNSNNAYLGTIEDISGHEAGTAWADTFYGNVGQIIERTQAASPNSKIVISSFVGYRPKAQIAGDIALNNALEAIAEYYGLPFINLKDDDFYMSDYYTNNILGKHPIAMLYSGMAMANARLFGKSVVDNQTYFKDYHMGTPAPDPEPDEPT